MLIGIRLSENGGEVYEEQRKRMIDVCCLQVRWRVQGSRMLVMEGRRYKRWWSEKEDGVGGVGVMEKE